MLTLPFSIFKYGFCHFFLSSFFSQVILLRKLSQRDLTFSKDVQLGQYYYSFEEIECVVYKINVTQKFYCALGQVYKEKVLFTNKFTFTHTIFERVFLQGR